MEEKYSIRNFLIKAVVAVVFIVLLIYLLPISKLGGNNSNNNNNSNTNNYSQELNSLTAQIFAANINIMKEAAMKYYTIERLPQNVGDKKKLTLQEMLNMKLVLPLIDKEGKTCDANASYVEIEKKDTEYQFKINLKCGSQEDYIIVPVGCYDYCPTKGGVCQKEIEINGKYQKVPGIPPKTVPDLIVTGPSCELYVSGGVEGTNGWFTRDVTVGFKYKTTSNNSAYITEYGLSESNVPTYNMLKQYQVTKEGVTNVYGYVKDSNGKTAICHVTVKKDSVKPNCELQIVDGIKHNGVYVGNVKVALTNSLDETSGVDSYGVSKSSQVDLNNKDSIVVNSNGNNTVYGYVKDKAGNINVCSLSFQHKDTPDNKISKPSCELEITSGVMGENNWYTSNVRVAFKSKKSTNGAWITQYGITNSNVEYNQRDFVTGARDGHYTVRGFVKDSNGNEAICSLKFKKDGTKPQCDLSVFGGIYQNGSYKSDVLVGWSRRYDNMSGVQRYGMGRTFNYNNNLSYRVTNDGTTTVYGYIKDNAGNTNICSINITKQKTGFEYQYKKTFNRQYSNWSAWQFRTYNPNSKPNFGSRELEEIVDLGYREVTKYNYVKARPIYSYVNKEFKTVRERSCDGFKYYRNEKTTTTSTTRTVHETSTEITRVETRVTDSYVTRKGTQGGERYVGMVSLSSPPTNTLSVRYEFVGMDFARCGNCTTTPYTIWKKYVRTVGKSQKVDTITRTYYKDSRGNPTTRIKSQNTTTNVNVTYSGVTVACNLVEDETTLFVKVKELAGFEKQRVAYTTKDYSYKYRNRTIISQGYVDYKWSYYNDRNLINSGYVMTGNKRITN